MSENRYKIVDETGAECSISNLKTTYRYSPRKVFIQFKADKKETLLVHVGPYNPWSIATKLDHEIFRTRTSDVGYSAGIGLIISLYKFNFSLSNNQYRKHSEKLTLDQITGAVLSRLAAEFFNDDLLVAKEFVDMIDATMTVPRPAYIKASGKTVESESKIELYSITRAFLKSSDRSTFDPFKYKVSKE